MLFRSPGGEPTEISCGDGADNDCDGLVDCLDPDCEAVTCAPGRVCAAGNCSGACVASETPEASCGDGADNDCDLNVDCADQDCNGASCGNTCCPNGAPVPCACEAFFCRPTAPCRN